MTLSVELKPEEVTWLSQAFTEKTTISPFSYISSGGFDDDNRQRLVQQGVIAKNGSVTGTYLPLLNAVAHANSYISMDLASGPVQLRVAVLRHDDVTVSMTAHGELLRWSSPAVPETVAVVFEDYLGNTPLKNVDLTLEVEPNTGLAFAALCDLYRRQVMSAFGAGQFFAQEAITADSIADSISQADPLPQLLTRYVRELCSIDQVPPSFDLETALTTLQENNLVEKHRDGYYLSGNAALFAGSFLAIENVMQLKAGEVSSGELLVSPAVLLQAGVHDLLYVERNDSGLVFDTMSSNTALKLLTELV